jgi:hypothetical protein
MKTTLLGLAAATILTAVVAQPAAAMPIGKILDQAQASQNNIINVQYRRHYRYHRYRHYRRAWPRWGYVGPRPYYAWGYPYRYYPYPYRYYGPGFGVQIGPFGFGVW